MNSPVVLLIVLLASAALWTMGLRLFLRSGLAPSRVASWTTFLLLIGTAVGSLLSLEAIWRRFLILVVAVPLLAAADVLVLRSERGVAFWIRACGFEVCTVFAVAAAARYALNLSGIGPLLWGVR